MAYIAKSKIEEMYRHFTDGFLNELKSDEFYDYFINAIRSGESNISIYEKYVERNIDLRWVEIIENTIIPLDNIIRTPMRFIKNEEEIVPIELVRNITTESIRHLAQHTSMIAQVKGDEVTPSRMLNILKEESFETYENRFIYTLIAKLEYFLDKRMQALKVSKDTIDKMEMKLNGNFTAGQDKISYDFSFNFETPHADLDNHENLVQTDVSQMSAMQRIDRVRKILSNFKSSALIKALQGCALVRPPLNMTNVLTKNQNFKKAVELWMFIESYYDIGCSVAQIERQVEPSNIYMNELFSILAMQYVVMKNNSGNMLDTNDYSERRVEQTPNIVKKEIDEFIDTFDLDIEEVRRIFLDRIQTKMKKRKMEYAKIKDVLSRAISLETERLEEERKLRAERIKREEELRKKEEARRLAEEQKRLEEERKRLEEEERIRQEEERKRLEEEERIRQEEEKKRLEEEERIRQEEERKRLEEEERIRQEEEKKRLEEEERIRQEEERKRLEEEERIRQEEEKKRLEEEERIRQEEEKKRLEEEERIRQEEEKKRLEEEERIRQEEEKKRLEEEERIRQEEEKKRLEEERAKALAEAEAAKATEEPSEEIAEEKKKAKLSFKETWLKIKEKLERKNKEAKDAAAKKAEESEAQNTEETQVTDDAPAVEVEQIEEASSIEENAENITEEPTEESSNETVEEEEAVECREELVTDNGAAYETVEEFFAPSEEIAKLHATDDGEIVYEGNGEAVIVTDADGTQSIYVNGVLFVKLRRKKRKNNSFKQKTYSSARKKQRNRRKSK